MNTAVKQDKTAAKPENTSYLPDELDLMTAEQLLEEYRRTGSEELKWQVALRYTGLVKSIALQIRGVYSSFTQVDDIINEGVLALVNAVDKFDPSKGKFETYVVKRIRGMIIDLARRQDWAPRSVRKRAKEIDQAVSELYSSLGRFPTDQEVSAHLGITEAQYQDALMNTSMCNVMSLEELFDEQDQWSTGPRAHGDAHSYPEQELLEKEMQTVLAKAITTLNEKEQQMLSLYYQKNLNMKEIAQVFGVSEPRISQIHAKAIQKLRLQLTAYMHGEA